MESKIQTNPIQMINSIFQKRNPTSEKTGKVRHLHPWLRSEILKWFLETYATQCSMSDSQPAIISLVLV